MTAVANPEMNWGDRGSQAQELFSNLQLYSSGSYNFNNFSDSGERECLSDAI